MQSQIGVDRQLPKNMTLSVNYLYSRGIHQFYTNDINTPVIGTYVPPIGTTPAQGFILSVRRPASTTCMNRAAHSNRASSNST